MTDDIKAKLAEIFSHGIVRACEAPTGTYLHQALSEAGALAWVPDDDVTLLLAASDGLDMTPTERAKTMLPLCLAALETGASDRKLFVREVGRMLNAELPLLGWSWKNAEDPAAELKNCVIDLAAHSPGVWDKYLSCLGKAYQYSRS